MPHVGMLVMGTEYRASMLVVDGFGSSRSTPRDLGAIDAELALLWKVRAVVTRTGARAPALWFDQLLDERNTRNHPQNS
jgi:hypothetical protein